MSYILDALKRADAERERGAVPGLHAQQNTALAAPAPARSRLRLWLISGAVLTLSSIAAGLWLWRGPASDTSLAAVQLAVVAPVVNAPVATPVAPPPPAPVPTVPATPAPVAPAAPTPVPAAVPAAVAALPQPVAPVAAPLVPLLSELPEDIRRQIPALVITGAVYSETPAQRLLLVNNLVLNQGGQAAPEVSLEEIRPKSSVFSFRGTRFRVAH
jgi:general secretion pathway protein B